MKKSIFILFLVLLLPIAALAQLVVKPGSFKEVPGFVNINRDVQYDDNNLPYAVIKVRTENINDKQRHQLKFSGNAGTFIELEYKDGEVWVYLTAKYAEYLKISHPDFSSMEFYLPYDLKPKCGYEMVLVNNFVDKPVNLQTNQPGENKEVNNAKQVINYSDGRYEGSVLNGKRHGKGKMIWDDGDVYDGDWKNDEMTGNGQYTCPNGNVYNGYWKNSKRNGYGTMKYSNGVYEGEWKNDQRTGKGKYTWSDGDVYEGDWKNGEITGKGVFKLPSGDVYKGDFVDGVRTGEGIYTWSNGNVYEGDWKNGERTGKGVFKWPSGDVYKGDFVDGVRTGEGIYTWPNGNVYNGHWQDNNRNGYGTMKYSDGVYEGHWKDDVRCGQGKFTSSDGKVTEGEWKNDELVKNNTIWYILTIIIAVIAFVLLLRLKEGIVALIGIGVSILFIVSLIIYCYCLIVGSPNASTWGVATLAGMGGGVIALLDYGIVSKQLGGTFIAIFFLMACMFVVGLIVLLYGWIDGSSHNPIWNILTLIGFCAGVASLILSMVFDD